MEKRCFLQWFILALTYSTILFFCGYFNIIQTIWLGDATHITSVIGIFFLVVCSLQGYSAWNYHKEKLAIAYANANMARTFAFLITLIGLFGTAVGLMLQAKALGSIDINNTQSVIEFMKAFGGSLSTALYATSCGIVGCYGITIMNMNLEYFIECDTPIE